MSTAIPYVQFTVSGGPSVPSSLLEEDLDWTGRSFDASRETTMATKTQKCRKKREKARPLRSTRRSVGVEEGDTRAEKSEIESTTFRLRMKMSFFGELNLLLCEEVCPRKFVIRAGILLRKYKILWILLLTENFDDPDGDKMDNSMGWEGFDEALPDSEYGKRDCVTLSDSSSDIERVNGAEAEVAATEGTAICAARPVGSPMRLDLPDSLIALIESDGEPKSFAEAMKSKEAHQWLPAAIQEMNQHKRRGTWKLVERPVGEDLLTCRWVLVKKRNTKGEVVRYKPRLVIRGFLQTKGVNYFETYAAVVRTESMKLLIIIALVKRYKCRHVDFVTAFLNGTIEARIFMNQQEVFDDGSGRVCKILHSLYGIKQASRLWKETLNKHLEKIGF
ncbi:hypothetical protein PsorP6_006049 [Peronosclerospora sorghi]|uniref:Uncharacterized protein n=1 Tax=Peronosclerospora sorghi TaxID=230839 RepID=A0ACC0W815_9STRA|nr:hypothetical protein PsorP6_006049 [Peronosclerospora sorghi]